MKFIKISLYAVLALVLVVFVGAVFFVVSFDANDYKAQISEQVKQQTGRELGLGDIKPSIFPWIGIELQQLVLSNAEGFNDSPMMQVERVDVRIELLPLLKQAIHVDTLRIHGLALILQKNRQGKTNWDDILEKQQAASEVSKGEKVPATQVVDAEGTAGVGELPLFKVNGIEIKDAQVQWNDAQLEQKITLTELNVESGVIQLGQSVPLQISALIHMAKPATSIQLQTDVAINFDLKTQQLVLDDFSLDLNAGLSEFDIDSLALHLQTTVRADLEKQTFSLPTMTLDIDAKGKAIPGGEIQANIATAIELDLLTQWLQLKQLKINVLDLNIKSQLQISKFIDAPSVQGRIDIESFNPEKLFSQLALSLPEMQNDQALQSAAIGFDIEAGTNSMLLKPLNISLDESTLEGYVSVAEFAQPKIEYKLNLDKINLDSYLSPLESVAATPGVVGGASDVSATPVAKASTAEDVVIELPVAMLRTLNLSGRLGVDNIKGFEHTIKQLTIESHAENGLIKITKLNAQLLEGSVASSAQLDVRKNTPLYQLNVKGNGIKADSIVNPLLQELLGESAVGISGASYLVLSLNTKGQSVNQLIANSNGDVAFKADNAVMQGVDAEYFVRKAVVAYLEEKKIPLKEAWKGEYTPKETTAIKTLRATASIRQGVIQNNDLLLDASRFKITGAGSINLPKETLRYRTVVDVQPQRTKTTAEQLVDIPLPIMITGNFAQPMISVDKKTWTKQLSKALTDKAKEDVKQKVERKKDEKIEALKDKYKDKFKGLFK